MIQCNYYFPLLFQNNSISTEGVHNIDTRFKGKKRVAVDYEHENLKGVQPSTSRVGSNEASLPKRPNIGEYTLL